MNDAANSFGGHKNKEDMTKKEKLRKQALKFWSKIASGLKYKRAATRELYYNTLHEIEDDVYDGIILSLASRNSNKSLNVQKRILRRIVEKKQSQVAHRYYGHTDSRLAQYAASACTKHCMRELYRYQNFK